MAKIAQLQNDLNVLLTQETKANSEKHLVLSMLCESYTQRLNDIGYSYHTLLGFYQEAVEVLNHHFREHKLNNLLAKNENSQTSQKLLQQARSLKGPFMQRWSFLDFENAITSHLDDSYFKTNSEDPEIVQGANYPLFTKPFFIALKNLRS